MHICKIHDTNAYHKTLLNRSSIFFSNTFIEVVKFSYNWNMVLFRKENEKKIKRNYDKL